MFYAHDSGQTQRPLLFKSIPKWIPGAHLVTHGLPVAHVRGEVFAVECEEFVRKLSVQQDVEPLLDLQQLGGFEGVARVIDRQTGSFGDVDLVQTLTPDTCLSEQEVSTNREQVLQTVPDVVH